MAELQLLVVEDDLEHFQIMRRALEGAGVPAIRHFTRGEDLLAFLQECGHAPTHSSSLFCILLDLGLPGISGEETLARLKENSEWGRIPVIVLTMTHDPRCVAQCHKLGCSHFISKPLDSEKFAHTLTQIGLFVNSIELPRPFRKV